MRTKTWLRQIGSIVWGLGGCMLLACNPTALAGSAATFQVTATLQSNTCGPQGVAAPTTLVYSMVLDTNGTSAMWNVASSGVSASGSYTASQSSFRFEVDSQSVVRQANTAYYGQLACTVATTDIVQGTLTGALPLVADAGQNPDAAQTVYVDASTTPDAGPPTFQALETLVIGATSGSDCSDQIGATSGQYSALPCEVIYQLTAVMTGPATQ